MSNLAFLILTGAAGGIALALFIAGALMEAGIIEREPWAFLRLRGRVVVALTMIAAFSFLLSQGANVNRTFAAEPTPTATAAKTSTPNPNATPATTATATTSATAQPQATTTAT